MAIPAISKTLKREMFARSIERDSVSAQLIRSRTRQKIELSVRLANPSHSRKLSIIGTHEEIPDRECKVAMPLKQASSSTYEEKPEPRQDRLKVGDELYRIIDSEALEGTGCYRLTLSLEA